MPRKKTLLDSDTVRSLAPIRGLRINLRAAELERCRVYRGAQLEAGITFRIQSINKHIEQARRAATTRLKGCSTSSRE